MWQCKNKCSYYATQILIFTFLQQQPKNNSSKNNFFNKGHEKVKYEFPFMIHQQ